MAIGTNTFLCAFQLVQSVNAHVFDTHTNITSKIHQQKLTAGEKRTCTNQFTKRLIFKVNKT